MILVVEAEEHPKLILAELGNVYNHCWIVVSGKLAHRSPSSGPLAIAIAQSTFI
jgi:hypothetical protein